ncbi:hypothetical protein EON79_05145 [bacterium]|nr:MAG: hypothetical protein EON79_05145 [bacterium]
MRRDARHSGRHCPIPFAPCPQAPPSGALADRRRARLRPLGEKAMTLDCEATFRKMQDYLDRELSPEEALLVREHLEGCGMCAEEYRFEASVLQRIRLCLTDEPVPEDLFMRVSMALSNS